jgi:hypothetical protein
VVKQGQVSPVDAERAKEVLQKGQGDKGRTPRPMTCPRTGGAPASPRRQPAPGPAINSGA